MNNPKPPPVPTATSTPHWTLQKRIVVLTNRALYLMSFMADSEYSNVPVKKNEPAKSLPMLQLERRIPLESSEGVQRVHLSKFADNCIGFSIAPHTVIAEPEKASKLTWTDNKEVNQCPVTGTPFTLFHRRHHCRFSGQIYSHEASNFM